MKKIVFTGGGTAGHIIPNIAIIEELQNYKIYYLGSNGMEKEIINANIVVSISEFIKFFSLFDDFIIIHPRDRVNAPISFLMSVCDMLLNILLTYTHRRCIIKEL